MQLLLHLLGAFFMRSTCAHTLDFFAAGFIMSAIKRAKIRSGNGLCSKCTCSRTAPSQYKIVVGTGWVVAMAIAKIRCARPDRTSVVVVLVFVMML